jgi:hypothetical protein
LEHCSNAVVGSRVHRRHAQDCWHGIMLVITVVIGLRFRRVRRATLITLR